MSRCGTEFKKTNKKVLDFRRQEEFRVSESPAHSLLSLIKISHIFPSFSVVPHPPSPVLSQSVAAQASLTDCRQVGRKTSAWILVELHNSSAFAMLAYFLSSLRTPTEMLPGLHIESSFCPIAGVKYSGDGQTDREGGRDRWRVLSNTRK